MLYWACPKESKMSEYRNKETLAAGVDTGKQTRCCTYNGVCVVEMDFDAALAAMRRNMKENKKSENKKRR